MPQAKPLAREREPIEFKPVPGMEDEWAGLDWEPAPIWSWLGRYPLLVYIAIIATLIGLS